jgi:ABC-type dipeptide/oligopeptide/nickel transport system permease component
VAQLILQRAPATLELAFAAFLLKIVIALGLGVTAALRQRSFTEWFISSFVGFAIAIPNFWLGILSIIVFALFLGVLPPGGHGDLMKDPGQALKFLILPAVTLALPGAAGVSRLVKASMLEVLYEDYDRTAHAKGLSRFQIVVRHALRNALVPVITALGYEFGRLLGGAVVTEAVFAWPGLGSLMLQGIGNRDYAIVQAGLLLLIVVFILINLLTDIAYGFLDPRIRLSTRATS